MGDPTRIALVAADLVARFEKRLEAMDGKAMIFCMSRRMCVDLYDPLQAPEQGKLADQKLGRRGSGT